MPEMTKDELVALFAEKAAAPPHDANKLLVSHLRCKESTHLADALRQVIDRFPGQDSRPLPTPSELLPPLA